MIDVAKKNSPKKDHPFLDDIKSFPGLLTQWDSYNGGRYSAKIIGFVLDSNSKDSKQITLGAVLAVNSLKNIKDVKAIQYVANNITKNINNYMRVHVGTYEVIKVDDIKTLEVDNPLTEKETASAVFFILKRKWKAYKAEEVTDSVTKINTLTDFTRIMKDLYIPIAINSLCQLIFKQPYSTK